MKLLAFIAVSAAFLRAQSPSASIPPETVVAKADGKSITAGEIRTILQSGDPNVAAMAKNNPEQFLGSVFVMRYLAAEGEKAHIADQSPWKEQLEVIRSRLLTGAMVNQIRETYNVPEQDIKTYYANNQRHFEQAWIKVLAIGFCPAMPTGTSIEEMKEATRRLLENPCATKRTEVQASAEAAKLVARIRAGEDYLKLVEKYSEDEDSKATAGDFGLVTAGNSIPAEIKSATFALRDGDVSDPVRSGRFFYIVKIKEKTVQPLAGVQDQIIQDLKQKHFTDWMADLTRRFKPEIERPDFFTVGKP